MKKKQGKIVKIDGAYECYLNGRFHCDDGPAVINRVGSKFWYQYGLRHRIGGPATEWFNGVNVWYQNDLLHNEEGPAITTLDGAKEWWLNGVRYDPIEWLLKVHELGIK